MKNKQYKVIRSTTLDDLNHMVSNLLNCGWSLAGNFQVITYSTNICYYQPMIK